MKGDVDRGVRVHRGDPVLRGSGGDPEVRRKARPVMILSLTSCFAERLARGPANATKDTPGVEPNPKPEIRNPNQKGLVRY